MRRASPKYSQSDTSDHGFTQGSKLQKINLTAFSNKSIVKTISQKLIKFDIERT